MPFHTFVQTMAGPFPTTFTGDRAQAHQFLDEFRRLERANLRHLLITRPALRVELALTFIRGPLTDPWKRTVRRACPGETEDEELADEFYDSFCTAWVDDPTPPIVIPCPPPPPVITTIQSTPVGAQTTAASPPIPAEENEEDNSPAPIAVPTSPDSASSTIPASAAQRAQGPRVIPAPIQTLVAPSIAPPPRVSTPQNDHVAQRVEKCQCDYTSDEEETRRHKYPRPAAHAGPPRASPQLGRRSVPLPRKFVYRQRRATSAAITSAPRFLIPYMPPPRRPPSPPDDPDHAPPLVDPDPRPPVPSHMVVKGDNNPMRGVKTLDISGFDSSSAQDDADSTLCTEDSRPQIPLLTPDTADLSPQTPPHAYTFPRHALERPHDPDEVNPTARR
ncbi:hypothetical protein EDB89DRAFT_2149062 [Lactarius sanguifluus]|nr:hypothetical protein EDB89DRAFT_2149062 [Lactarius sanguifluus]